LRPGIVRSRGERIFRLRARFTPPASTIPDSLFPALTMLTERHLHCPWCGEGFDAFVDLSYGESEYVEDCPVCCRPITLSLRVDGDGELEDLGVDRE
jgi:hypothetical protein